MAFGIKRPQLTRWKQTARSGEIAFLTHYWLDDRFPDCTTVTKVACCDMNRLVEWGSQYGLKKEWIHVRDEFPHFDLFGEWQETILMNEGQIEQLTALQHK